MKISYSITAFGGLTGALALFVCAAVFFTVCDAMAQGEPAAADVKKPSFAGSFYPADRLSLQVLVDTSLKEAEKDGAPLSSAPFAIMAPHAGYVYSGKVAAYAYNSIRGKGFKTIILLGPSHREALGGIALYPSGAWETPLGKVQIDRAMGRRLASMCAGIKENTAIFSKEHSLEVQLPFLQRTLEDFRIVPLLVGSMGERDYQAFADALKSVLKQGKGKVLIVVSSDMSHYHPYSDAVRMDSSTLELVEQLKREPLARGIREGTNELCGAPGVITVMMAAEKLGGEARILKYANSGDTAGDRSRVVGYGSVAFLKPVKKKGGDLLSGAEKKKLLAISRKTLEEHVSARTVTDTPVSEQRLLERRGAFVTLNIKGQLRGCIGYIKPVVPLYKAVMEMTVAASSKDMRFRPVTMGELKDITIEISVLTPLKLINSVNEIQVGTHGLYIVHGFNSGLLLPQVATHYHWGREEFLRHTCSKAGLPADAWKDKEARIYIFSAQIFSE